MRKLACAAVVLVFAVGLVVAEEFNVLVTKVSDGKITGSKVKKGEKGEEVTLSTTADVKVTKGGKFNKEEKKFEGGEEVTGGLKNEVFSKLPDKGLLVRVTTNDDGKVSQVRILGGKKKKDAQ